MDSFRQSRNILTTMLGTVDTSRSVRIAAESECHPLLAIHDVSRLPSRVQHSTFTQHPPYHRHDLQLGLVPINVAFCACALRRSIYQHVLPTCMRHVLRHNDLEYISCNVHRPRTNLPRLSVVLSGQKRARDVNIYSN